MPFGAITDSKAPAVDPRGNPLGGQKQQDLPGPVRPLAASLRRNLPRQPPVAVAGQAASGAAANWTLKALHQITALLKREMSVPAGTS